MTKKLSIRILLFCAVPFGLQAQLPEQTKPAISLVGKVNNLYHLSKKPLNNFYSLGGELGIYFNDQFYLGMAQYSSISPSDIWKNNPYNPDKIRVYEYSLQAGYKIGLPSSVYLYTGVRSGYSAMHMEYRYNNGVDSDETMTREKSGGLFITPEIKSGIQVHKNIAIEAGLNYRYNFGNKDKWGLNTDRLNGIGAVISIVGHIPL